MIMSDKVPTDSGSFLQRSVRNRLEAQERADTAAMEMQMHASNEKPVRQIGPMELCSNRTS